MSVQRHIIKLILTSGELERNNFLKSKQGFKMYSIFRGEKIYFRIREIWTT